VARVGLVGDKWRSSGSELAGESVAGVLGIELLAPEHHGCERKLMA